MVLPSSPSANTTPSDSSNAEGVLQSLYHAVSAPFTPGNGNLDTTLLMEEPPLSYSDIGGMDIPTITITPAEGSMIDRLCLVQQSGKSVGLMDSSGGLSVTVSDLATFASLAAGSDLFDDQTLMEVQENQDYSTLANTSNIATSTWNFNDDRLLSVENLVRP